MDINQIPAYQTIVYGNNDFISGNNSFPNIISRGIVLDLSDLTSEKDVFSVSVFYHDRNNSKIVLENASSLFNLKYYDEVQADQEYIVYIDIGKKELIMRYYEFGVKYFNSNEFLISRISSPYDDWNLEEGIYNNSIIVEFYSYNGKLIWDNETVIYNSRENFIEKIPDYCLLFVNLNNNYQFYSFKLGFNKMSVMMNVDGDEEDADSLINVNMEFVKPLEFKRISNNGINVNDEYPWSCLALLYRNEEMERNDIIMFFINNLFEFYENGYELFSVGLKKEPDFNHLDDPEDEHFFGIYSLFTENGGIIESTSILTNDIEKIYDDDNNDIGYRLITYFDENFEYSYKDEL